MTTELRRFNDAYASMTVAVYEPFFVRWVSNLAIRVLADGLAIRTQLSQHMSSNDNQTSLMMMNSAQARYHATLNQTQKEAAASLTASTSTLKKEKDTSVIRGVNLPGHPSAIRVDETVYPEGLKISSFGRAPEKTIPESDSKEFGIPVTISRFVRRDDKDFDLLKARQEVQERLEQAVAAAASHPDRELSTEMFSQLAAPGKSIVLSFLPLGAILNEQVSPIGLAHFYRQLYFNASEGVGPIEQAFTIAPNEQLEVLYETTRKQIHEETLEVGSEKTSETAVENKNLTEVSDKVSSMLQRDSSAAASASMSGSLGVWDIGVSGSASYESSRKRGRETATRKLKEVTTRASERIRKTVTIRTRDVEEISETNLTRRMIRNGDDGPVSYALRRVLRKVKVKVQDLGTAMVWQLYVKDPGRNLIRSRYVSYMKSSSYPQPLDLPELPKQPEGGTEEGEAIGALFPTEIGGECYFPLTIDPGPDRIVESVQVTSITDMEMTDEDEDKISVPSNRAPYDAEVCPDTNRYKVKIPILVGDCWKVSITYTYRWSPSPNVWEDYNKQKAKLIEDYKQQQAEAEFESKKKEITERSRIRPRPAAALRKEECNELMNRLVTHLFNSGDNGVTPTPIEIESLYRYFDVNSTFHYSFPTWWKPRYRCCPEETGTKPEYEITSESEPARLGSSLGWLIQLDGDDRRNQFLNTPWVRVCIPIRPGRETAAIQWLAKHIEGQNGLDFNSNPLKALIDSLKTRREKEDALGMGTPDYVSKDTQVVDATAIAPDAPATPENLYPVIDEFEVTVPTEGFVYEKLEISGGQ